MGQFLNGVATGKQPDDASMGLDGLAQHVQQIHRKHPLAELAV